LFDLFKTLDTSLHLSERRDQLSHKSLELIRDEAEYTRHERAKIAKFLINIISRNEPSEVSQINFELVKDVFEAEDTYFELCQRIEDFLES